MHDNLLNDLNVMKIDAVRAILYARAQLNFCPYVPHLFSDWVEINCRRSTHNAVKRF